MNLEEEISINHQIEGQPSGGEEGKEVAPALDTAESQPIAGDFSTIPDLEIVPSIPLPPAEKILASVIPNEDQSVETVERLITIAGKSSQLINPEIAGKIVKELNKRRKNAA